MGWTLNWPPISMATLLNASQCSCVTSQSGYVRRQHSRLSSERMLMLPDSWNRYSMIEKLLCFLLCERLGNLACLHDALHRSALCLELECISIPMATIFLHTALLFWPVQKVHLLCPSGNDTDYNYKKTIVRRKYFSCKLYPHTVISVSVQGATTDYIIPMCMQTILFMFMFVLVFQPPIPWAVEKLKPLRSLVQQFWWWSWSLW